MSNPQHGYNPANNEPTGYGLDDSYGQGQYSPNPYAQAGPHGPGLGPQSPYGTVSPYQAFQRNDRPAVGMGTAVKLMFKNYGQFYGRASRSEYWFAALATGLAYLVMFIPLVVAMANDWPGLGLPMMALMAMFMVATVVPTLSLQVRRLHDAGQSGWWTLLNFTSVGSVVVLILSACDPKAEGARFDNPNGSHPAKN